MTYIRKHDYFDESFNLIHSIVVWMDSNWYNLYVSRHVHDWERNFVYESVSEKELLAYLKSLSDIASRIVYLSPPNLDKQVS